MLSQALPKTIIKKDEKINKNSERKKEQKTLFYYKEHTWQKI